MSDAFLGGLFLVVYHLSAIHLFSGWQGGSSLASNNWLEEGWVFLRWKAHNVSVDHCLGNSCYIRLGFVYKHLGPGEWWSLTQVKWFAGKQKLWTYWKVLGSLAQTLTMLCSKERYKRCFNWIKFQCYLLILLCDTYAHGYYILSLEYLSLSDCIWNIFFIDCIIDIDERLWEIGFIKGNWWHSSLWGETTWKFENYARNWWAISFSFSFMYVYVYMNLFFACVSGNKRKQIIQVVQYLDERLKELDEEKEELRKYQQLDKQRKSLEYTIYDKELHDARQKLAEVS